MKRLSFAHGAGLLFLVLSPLRFAQAAEQTTSTLVKAIDPGSITDCQKIVDRYRHIASRHRGEFPLEALSKSPNSGVVFGNSMAAEFSNPKIDLVNWAQEKRPPVLLPENLIAQLDDRFIGNHHTTLYRLPDTDYYSIEQTQGSLYCRAAIGFVVKNGRAELGPSTETGNGQCFASTDFGMLDKSPVFFSSENGMGPSMTMEVHIQSWKDGEPPRKSRRLHYLREWSHGKSIEVFPGDAGASGSDGAGAPSRA